MAEFPAVVSFTITNACNLRCAMCGQWSEHGYVRHRHGFGGEPLRLEDWKRLADEVADRGVGSVLVRGGEPFLWPPMLELLEHMRGRGLFVSIDSNGTRLAAVAADLVRLGGIHVTVSVDGPEPVHDAVRGAAGCFREIAAGLKRLAELDGGTPRRVSRSICFTISPWSVRGLGEMPAVARSLGVETLVIVPYCFVAGAAGAAWTREVRELVDREAFSWRGFEHENSGVDGAEFAGQHRRYRETLGGLFEYPYFTLSAEQFRLWFSDATVPVEPPACSNVERLIDIQPTGEANFCVDLPDAALGNVKEATIAEIWNGAPAQRFRERRRQGTLGACHRCVARHMGDIRN